MNKYAKIAIFTAVALLFGGVIAVVTNPALAVGLFSLRTRYLGNNEATTTPTYLTAGAASSSLTLFSERADIIGMNVQYKASSTATTPKLQWSYEFSQNETDWYGEDLAIYPSALTTGSTTEIVHHSTSTPVHEWNPDTTATTTKHVLFPFDLVSKHVRVKFQAVGSNGALHVEAIEREPAN